MPNEARNTLESGNHSQILNDTIKARITVIDGHHILDTTAHLKEYFNAVNLEGLSDVDKKVLAELIPYASGLIIPAFIEDYPPYKSIFDDINRAEFDAGSNLLLPDDNQTPSDECIKDAVANFRAFIVTLDAMRVNDLTERTTEKVTNALARMFVDIGYPLPPELLEKISSEEFENLKLLSDLHTQGSILGEQEFIEGNEKIRRGESADLPVQVQLATSDSLRQILEIYAEVDAEEHQEKMMEFDTEREELVSLYMEFAARYPDLRTITSFLLNYNGKAEPLAEDKPII